mmetsp:Transcript_164601/g.528030  ORF Transcript_164601/g.528030 Transcript_164601/m.528030 type:complete len:121 (-) Transcript_164601:1362-1724(-)
MWHASMQCSRHSLDSCRSVCSRRASLDEPDVSPLCPKRAGIGWLDPPSPSPLLRPLLDAYQPSAINTCNIREKGCCTASPSSGADGFHTLCKMFAPVEGSNADAAALERARVRSSSQCTR